MSDLQEKLKAAVSDLERLRAQRMPMWAPAFSAQTTYPNQPIIGGDKRVTATIEARFVYVSDYPCFNVTGRCAWCPANHVGLAKRQDDSRTIPMMTRGEGFTQVSRHNQTFTQNQDGRKHAQATNRFWIYFAALGHDGDGKICKQEWFLEYALDGPGTMPLSAVAIKEFQNRVSELYAGNN